MKKRINRQLRLKVGELVEVLSKDEILATLDKDGRLEGMPFMPTMFQFCGKRFRVFKRAHKTCDTVFPIRSRRLSDTVHLETRCDGQAYGGCQAGCLLFWKERWLRRVSANGEEESNSASGAGILEADGCTEEDVYAGRFKSREKEGADTVYVCQNTQVPYATSELSPWDLRQYVEDYTSGNVGLWDLIRGGAFGLYHTLTEAGIGLGRILRWFYNTFHFLWGGSAFPWNRGSIPVGAATPSKSLNLEPGELVRIKAHAEILETITVERKNRGMYFDADQVPYCGSEQRVLRRVGRIIDEKTGKLINFKNEAIVLEGVYCKSRYSYCRMHCPRAIYSYWREVWLERTSETTSNSEAGKDTD